MGTLVVMEEGSIRGVPENIPVGGGTSPLVYLPGYAVSQHPKGEYGRAHAHDGGHTFRSLPA